MTSPTPDAPPRDTFPAFTPYGGPLPIPVQTWLDGHPARKLDARPVHPDSATPERQFCTSLTSEHGWRLAAGRCTGATPEAALQACHAMPLHHVQPRVSENRSYWC